MTDFWCWLVGCGSSSVHDAARAVPEIATSAVPALVAFVGGLLGIAEGTALARSGSVTYPAGTAESAACRRSTFSPERSLTDARD